MAITIHDTPQTFTPSDNPVVWTFSSNQTAQNNFAYLVDVYINDTLVAESELIFPEDGIYARFDATNFASNNCDQPSLITGALVGNADNYCQVKIRVWEYYGTTPAKQASQTTSNIYAWKAGLTNFDFIDWDVDEYAPALSGVAPYNWLTQFPTSKNRIVKETNEKLYVMAITNDEDIFITITLFEADGTQIVQVLDLELDSNIISIFKLDPDEIVAQTTITAADFTNCSYYTVSTNNFEEFRVDIDKKCVYDYAKRFHFLTRIGAIESFTFHLISRESAKIQSSSFERNFGEWNGSSFEFNKDRGTSIDYHKTVMPMMKIESDWIDETVQRWLVENLYSSVRLLEELQDTNNTLVERKITTASYEIKYNQNDMLFNEVIEVKLPTHSTLTL